MRDQRRVLELDGSTKGATAVSKSMCYYCWHQRTAQRQNQAFAIIDPIYTRRFYADGSVDVFFNPGFGDPSIVGQHVAHVEPGALPSTDTYARRHSLVAHRARPMALRRRQGWAG